MNAKLNIYTKLCSPSIYKKIISPNTLNLNNSFRDTFKDEMPIYKRGNFHVNNVMLQRILGSLYGIDTEQFPGHVALTSSGVSLATIFAASQKFNRILYDTIYPEMIESFSVFNNAFKFESISQIEKGDLVCIESYQLPECIDNKNKIKMISEYAHYKNAYVLVDNSCLTGVNWNPFSADADFCIESLAKNTCGFNNSLVGLLAVNPHRCIDNDISIKLLDSIRFFGFYPNPIDCYLISLGIQTLPMRLERIKNTTKLISNELNKFDDIKFNSAPELGLIFIEHNGVSVDKFNQMKIIQSAGVFGVNYTIIDIMEKINYIRISVGLESFDDLIDDIMMLVNIIKKN